MSDRFIVAEISKNWPAPMHPTVANLFEEIINANDRRGYDLLQFHTHAVMTSLNDMVETIIAVFQKREVKS